MKDAITEFLRLQAEAFVDLHGERLGLRPGFDAAGVELLSAYIDSLRDTLTDKDPRHPHIEMLGSFLGECIIRSYGGKWQKLEGKWGVQLENAHQTLVFPFDRVEAQLARHDQGNVVSFFLEAPHLDEL